MNQMEAQKRRFVDFCSSGHCETLKVHLDLGFDSFGRSNKQKMISFIFGAHLWFKWGLVYWFHIGPEGIAHFTYVVG